MRVALEALIKYYKPIVLDCGDKQIIVELRLNDENTSAEILNALGALYDKAPERTVVVMMDKDELNEELRFTKDAHTLQVISK